MTVCKQKPILRGLCFQSANQSYVDFVFLSSLRHIFNEYFESHSLLAEKMAVLKQFWIKQEERQATDKVKLARGLKFSLRLTGILQRVLSR